MRDTFFALRSVIPSASITDWLSGNGLPVAPSITLPGKVMSNDDVGSATFFNVLAMVSAALQPEVTVEFGTYLGIGTSVLTMNSPGRVVTVDLPDDASDSETHSLNASDINLVKRSRHRVGSAFRGTSLEGRITQILSDSRVLNLADYVRSATLTVIDGGHSYDCVAADTKNALLITERGGVIIWDDYFWLYPDVVRFLEELSHKYRLVHIKRTHAVALRIV